MIMLIKSKAIAIMNVVPNVKSFRYIGSTQPLPNFVRLKILKQKNYDLNPLWLGITPYELLHIEKGWVIPFSEYKTFKFKYNYQPGNLGNFDMSTISDNLLNKELNNGRLAMIAFMGILTQELVTGKNIF